MLEQLFERLLDDRDPSSWRDVPLGPARDAFEFGREVQSVLCTDSPADWGPQDAETFGAQQLGHAQSSRAGDLLFFFRTPWAAFQSALALQRGNRSEPLRVALATASFTYAEIRQHGHTKRFYFGDELARAERLILSSVPGTLQLCPESYRALHDLLPTEVPDALVATELVGNEVMNASITFPPPSDALLSTFAGLGLL